MRQIRILSTDLDDWFFVDLYVLCKSQTWNCLCFDLQNWKNNFRFATLTKYVNQEKHFVKSWHYWRYYESVSYSFSCTPKVQIVTILKPKNCFVAGSPAICDRTILAGWYRFDSPAGNLIPTECPGENYCGTRKPVWLNGRHCSLFFYVHTYPINPYS